MPNITPETVKKFKQIFKDEYGVEYSDQEAWEATHNLLGAFEWLIEEDRKQKRGKRVDSMNGDKH